MKNDEVLNNREVYKYELLDLMKRTDKVLTQNGIRYFGVFGTCLGAVRENGLIPWDDDIDIAVYRADFENAVAHLTSSNARIFVAEKGFRSARIFNRISYADEIERQRAYIDLYVIDYAPQNNLVYKWNVLWYVGLSRILARRNGSVGNLHPLQYFCADAITFFFRCLPLKVIERIASWFYIGTRPSSLIKLSYDANRKRYPAKYFLKSILFSFEDFEMPVPWQYDEYLTLCYGDWRTPPKEEDRNSHAFDKSGKRWTVKLPEIDERKVVQG